MSDRLFERNAIEAFKLTRTAQPAKSTRRVTSVSRAGLAELAVEPALKRSWAQSNEDFATQVLDLRTRVRRAVETKERFA